MTWRVISSTFISSRLPLKWDEVLYGYENGMIGWSAPVDFAISALQSGSDDALEIELAGVSKNETFLVGDLLTKLCRATQAQSKAQVQRKWLYLQLAWLFENRLDSEDPFAEVDELYSDFGYPSTIEHFVSFMPAKGDYNPERHTLEENRNHIIKLWKEFLAEEQDSLGACG